MPLGFAFQGVASKLGFRDTSQLKWRFWMILDDFGGWECALNGSKSFQTCGVVQILLKLTVDGERFVAGAGNREVVSCGRGECRCHIGIGA